MAGQYSFYPKLLKSSDDLDAVKDGCYCFANGNTPEHSIGSNGVVIQIGSSQRDDKYQVLFETNSRKVYMRLRTASWSDWKEAFSFI